MDIQPSSDKALMHHVGVQVEKTPALIKAGLKKEEAQALKTKLEAGESFASELQTLCPALQCLLATSSLHCILATAAKSSPHCNANTRVNRKTVLNMRCPTWSVS